MIMIINSYLTMMIYDGHYIIDTHSMTNSTCGNYLPPPYRNEKQEGHPHSGIMFQGNKYYKREPFNS